MTIPLIYNWRSLLIRKATMFATAGGIALVVVVMLLVLSLISSLQLILVKAGSPDNLLVMRKGATNDAMSFVPRAAVQALRYLPGIARTLAGDPLVSPELLTQPLLPTQGGGRQEAMVRGVTPLGFVVHPGLHFIAGRAPRSALSEVAAGVAASHYYRNAVLGGRLQFGGRTWNVVGIFTAEGASFESELWVDVDDLLDDTNRTAYSVVSLVMEPGTDRRSLIQRIANDPRISLEAKVESDYYQAQASGANTLYIMTFILALIMSAGAIFGAMNTLFAAVDRRAAEIGILRAIGFSRGAVLLSFITESLCLALSGYALGTFVGVGAITLVNLLTQGIPFPLPSFSMAVVPLSLSPLIFCIVLLITVVIGIVGGLFPARRAAGLRVADAVRNI